MAGKNTVLCSECSKTFSDSDALELHNQRNHRAPLLSCYHCPFTTKFKFNLSNHITKNHVDLTCHPRQHGYAGTKSRNVAFLVCPLCPSFQCVHRSEMIQHYVTDHDVDLTEKRIEFSDAAEFSRWKKETEASESFRFVGNTTNKNRDSETKYFRCFRDGFFQSKGQGRRRLKIKGSCKTNGVCPCSLKVKIWKITGRVSVSYVSRHVGHTMDIGRMNLTKEQRASIAQKLSQHVPVDVILDTIREPTIDGNLQRIHLTTRKDLANIKESFQLSKMPGPESLFTRRCAALGCPVSYKTHPTVKFFAFPRKKGAAGTAETRLQEWREIAQNPTAGSGCFLCALHFSSDQFYDQWRTRLVRGSVPRYPTGPVNPVEGDYSPYSRLSTASPKARSSRVVTERVEDPIALPDEDPKGLSDEDRSADLSDCVGEIEVIEEPVSPHSETDSEPPADECRLSPKRSSGVKRQKHSKLATPKKILRGEMKLVIAVRTDLGMGKGKIAAQCSHAAVGCFKQAAKKFPQYLETWEYQGQPKIVVKLDTGGEEGLEELSTAAKHRGLPTKVIHDAGRTQIDSGTATVVGVGPGPADLVNEVTGHLKLL